MRIEGLPLAEALISYLDKQNRPFHMPGHKQGAGLPRELVELWGAEVFRYDLTELPGLDDLHAPREAILKAQEAAARCFGAEETWFLVNGSTVGIQAAVLACMGPEDLVLVPRQMHRSLLGGLILSGARPVYLPAEVEPVYGIPLASRTEAVEKALNDYNDIKAVVTVHPNYYGIAGDVGHTAGACRERGIPLLVDEAHGAHFLFDRRLPLPALEAGADAAVQSWHKLLTSLTQTAVLHCQGSRIDRERLRRWLSILQTTSPSYLLMLSLDFARWQMENHGEAVWSRVLELAEGFRSRVKGIPGLQCLGEEIKQSPSVHGWDPSKLLVKVDGLGITGFEAAGWLRDRAGVQAEMADPQNVLFMLTAGDNRESVECLERALSRLAREHPPVGSVSRWGGEGYRNLFRLSPRVILTPGQAFRRGSRKLGLLEAVGEISAETICPYPPGVPLLAPGEEITREIVETIKELKAWGIGWQGQADPLLETIRIIA